MFNLDAEFIPLVLELMDSEIEAPNAKYISVSSDATANTSRPWNITRGASTEYDVKILFFTDTREDRQFLKYRRETEVQDGLVNGYMYAYDAFEPKLKDYVIRDGQELVIKAIDKIAPVEKTLLYILEFGT